MLVIEHRDDLAKGLHVRFPPGHRVVAARSLTTVVSRGGHFDHQRLFERTTLPT
jgi:hypothetical protein